MDTTPAFHGHVLLGHVLLGDADDRVLDGMLQLAGPGVGTALLFAVLRHLGGALGRPAPGGGAVDHLRGEYSLTGVGVPMGPAAEAVPAQLKALESVGVHQSAGAYANLTETAGLEAIHAPKVLERLRAIKAKEDPADRIQASHPVT